MRRLLALPTAHGLIAGPLCAADPAQAVAVVDGEPITVAEMQVMLDQLGPQAAGIPPQTLFGMLRDQLVQQAVLAKAGAAAETAEDKAVLALQARSYLATAAMRRVAEPEPTAAELQAAYDKAFGAAAPKTEYNAMDYLKAAGSAHQGYRAVVDAAKAAGVAVDAYRWYENLNGLGTGGSKPAYSRTFLPQKGAVIFPEENTFQRSKRLAD